MSLSDYQIRVLAKRMSIPLETVCFKDKLVFEDFSVNKAYIINLDNSVDTRGAVQTGSHWTCFTVVEYPTGNREAMYFDSYGEPCPIEVNDFIGNNLPHKIPHSNKDIQGLQADFCGWACLAYLHWVYASEYRTGNLYSDTEIFLQMFKDLKQEPNEFKYNEFVLKHFFRSTDPEVRKKNPVSVFDFQPVDTSGIANPDTIVGKYETE